MFVMVVREREQNGNSPNEWEFSAKGGSHDLPYGL